MATIAPFKMIWDTWYLILRMLYSGISQADVLPVTVAIFAFFVLFYIAFRFFLLDRLLRDRGMPEPTMKKFSVVLSVAFTTLGVYLGWIPFVAAMFGAFYFIIAVLFMLVLWFAIWGSYRRAHADFSKTTALADKEYADSLKTRAEANLIENDAKSVKASEDALRQSYEKIAKEVGALEKNQVNFITALQQLSKYIGTAHTSIGRPQQEVAWANYLSRAMTSIQPIEHVMVTLSETVEGEYARDRLNMTSLNNQIIHWQDAENKLDVLDKKELKEIAIVLNAISSGAMAAVPEDKQTLEELKAHMKQLTAGDKVRKLKADMAKGRDNVTRWIKIAQNEAPKFQKFHSKQNSDAMTHLRALQNSISEFRANAGKGENAAELTAALNKAHDNVNALLLMFQNGAKFDGAVMNTINGDKVALANDESFAMNYLAEVERLENEILGPNGLHAKTQALARKVKHDIVNKLEVRGIPPAKAMAIASKSQTGGFFSPFGQVINKLAEQTERDVRKGISAQRDKAVQKLSKALGVK